LKDATLVDAAALTDCYYNYPCFLYYMFKICSRTETLVGYT